MKIATVTVCLVVATAAFVSAQTTEKTNSLQAELERLHSQWFAAFDKGDGETMDRMEVPNLILVSPDRKGTFFSTRSPRR